MNSARIKKILWGVAVGVLWLGPVRPVAAAGTIYLSPATGNLSPGGQVALALRINPGAPINGVHAEIGYDAGKLQLLSVGEEGSAFPEIAEQNSEVNPITLTRTTSGDSVSGDVLIITLHFKALASSGSTSITVSGNAASGTSPTNPAAQGATITFGSTATPSPPGSATPPPSSPGTGGSGQQNQQNQQPPTSMFPDGTEPQKDAEHPEDEQHAAASSGKKMTWPIWVGALAVAAVMVGIYWFIHRRQSNGTDLAAEHPIDATWAIPAASKPQNTQTDELLGHTPGVQKPDPGSVVAPNPKDDDPKV